MQLLQQLHCLLKDDFQHQKMLEISQEFLDLKCPVSNREIHPYPQPHEES